MFSWSFSWPLPIHRLSRAIPPWWRSPSWSTSSVWSSLAWRRSSRPRGEASLLRVDTFAAGQLALAIRMSSTNLWLTFWHNCSIQVGSVWRCYAALHWSFCCDTQARLRHFVSVKSFVFSACAKQLSHGKLLNFFCPSIHTSCNEHLHFISSMFSTALSSPASTTRRSTSAGRRGLSSWSASSGPVSASPCPRPA